MPRSDIFKPGSDLSKVRFEFDNNNQFPNLQETEPTETQQALNRLSERLREQDNPAKEVDPNWFTLRSYQYDLNTKILDAYINAVRETHQICGDLMPKSENVV